MSSPARTLRTATAAGAAAATLIAGLAGTLGAAHAEPTDAPSTTATETATEPAPPTATGTPAESAAPAAEEQVAAPVADNDLFVSEINGDNNGTDFYEYFEVHNRSASPIDLDAEQISFFYTSSDADGQVGGTLLTRGGEGTTLPLPAAPTTIPAGGTQIFWIQNSGETYLAKTFADFRANYGLAADVPLVRVTGQNGFNNGGGRAIRIVRDDTTEISRSYVPARTSLANGAVHFRVTPDQTTTAATVWHDGSVEAGFPISPGTIDPAQLAAPTEPTPTDPTTEPTATPTDPTTEPTTTPTEPSTEPTTTPTGPADPLLSARDLLITEIHPDNGSAPGGTTGPTNVDDNFEFFEVHNTTDAPINLAERGIGASYSTGSSAVTTLKWALSDGVAGNAVTAAPLDVTIPAGGSAVFWLEYGAAGAALDTYSRTEADFRAFFATVAPGAQVVKVEGQAGIANGGDRTIALVDDGQVISSSYLPPRAPTTPGASTHFAVPPTGAAAATYAGSDPTPGTVADEQVDPTQPTDPTDPTTEPTEPPGPTVPEQPPAPLVDPSLAAPILQVTEVAPDTANVGGGDGYEFVEVYNSSQSPLSWEDFTVEYLYLDADHNVTSSTLWPSIPDDVVIAPGKTLVLWVKNGSNQALTGADFNAHFGSRLVPGVDLVEMNVGGMANGGARGLQVSTNSGHAVSRADYMSDAETVADQPIQYRWDSGTRQTLVATGTATPGYTAATQVPGGLVADPATDTAPVVTDLTGGAEVPETENLDLAFTAVDDHQVRTVELTIISNVGDSLTRSLRFTGEDRYEFSVPAVDLYGKQWVDYSLVVRDGTHTVTLPPVRVTLKDGDAIAPVRLNVTDGQYVGGDTRVAAATSGDPADIDLRIDGAPVGAATPSLEAAPVFAFEASNTDAFFRNGVKLGDEVLTVFDQGFYSRWETVPSDVPLEELTRGEPFTVSIWAGTKGYPELSTDDNNDDFIVRNLRLALPDGRIVRPTIVGVDATTGATAIEPPVRTTLTPSEAASISMGDGASNYDYLEATFTLPDDAFNAVATTWETASVADGEHTVSARVGDGAGESVQRTVVVDNTVPAITTPLEEGRRYRGAFTIDAAATDAGSGLGSLTATLDGTPITLPHATSSVDLTPGDHEVVLTASDTIGNTSERAIAFTTGDESSTIELDGPADGAELPAGDVPLSASVTSAEGDDLTVSFRKGHTFDPTDGEVASYTGTTTDAAETARDGRTLLAGDALTDLVDEDGETAEVSSDSELPYQLFTVNVPADSGADATVRLAWAGSANVGAKVVMSVLNTATKEWEKVDQALTTTPGATSPVEFELGADVALADHVDRGAVTVLVQHSEGFAGTDRSTRESSVASYHPDATPRSDYDFTIGWESDTQYYNDNQGWVAGNGNPETFFRHQRNIHDFFLAERDNLNLQYMIHTGDIVDDAVATSFSGDNTDPEYQWKNADPEYRKLDEAGLPYGILAGNHDVTHATEDYTQYAKWFGKARYEDNPWYGGQLQDNRGSFNLVSAGGVDFLFLSMGWGPGDEQLEWMNDVIARHPERKVWISLHEYLLTTGTLGPIPQRIYDEVVTPNPNVFAVSSGHYHDAYTRTDALDDTGDGVADRTVYSMLFDYQGLAEGGLGYLRLLHFDNEGKRIIVRTYSPSLDDFDSDNESLNDPAGQQEFEIPYADAGLASVTKTLATDAFRADVLTTQEISRSTGVTSGSTVEATWPGLEAGEYGWFVEATGPHGAVTTSDVRSFTLNAPGDLVTSEPTLAGVAKVGSTLEARPGTWGPDGVTLTYQWLADGRPIAGATGARLTLAASYVGKRVGVRVTGTLSGYTTAERESVRTAPVAAGTIVGARPVVAGKAKVGKVLRSVTGAWTPWPVALTYRWFAGKKAIPGATSSTLRITRKMAGKKIRVQVTGTKPGHTTTTVTSAATKKVVVKGKGKSKGKSGKKRRG